jgi:hypothetical protein
MHSAPLGAGLTYSVSADSASASGAKRQRRRTRARCPRDDQEEPEPPCDACPLRLAIAVVRARPDDALARRPRREPRGGRGVRLLPCQRESPRSIGQQTRADVIGRPASLLGPEDCAADCGNGRDRRDHGESSPLRAFEQMSAQEGSVDAGGLVVTVQEGLVCPPAGGRPPRGESACRRGRRRRQGRHRLRRRPARAGTRDTRATRPGR